MGQSHQEAVEIGSYFDNVEATVVAVYGKASVVEAPAVRGGGGR